MDEISGFLEFLNYGAAGVLSLSFLLLLWMLWKRGEKDSKAIDALADRNEDKESLMSVVKCNTEAMTSIKCAVEENCRVIEKLNGDMHNRSTELSRDIRELRERM